MFVQLATRQPLYAITPEPHPSIVTLSEYGWQDVEVRALLGHTRVDTTQIYTRIRPPQLKRAVAFYEAQAERMLMSRAGAS